MQKCSPLYALKTEIAIFAFLSPPFLTSFINSRSSDSSKALKDHLKKMARFPMEQQIFFCKPSNYWLELQYSRWPEGAFYCIHKLNGSASYLSPSCLCTCFETLSCKKMYQPFRVLLSKRTPVDFRA